MKYKLVGMCVLLATFCFALTYWQKPDITFRNQADGFAYYLPLRSYMYDGDFDFTNENEAFENTYNATPYFWKEKTKNNLPVYHYSIGPSILWSPFLLFGSDDYKNHIQVPLLQEQPETIPGFSKRDLEAISFGSYFYGSLCLIFTFLFLMRVFPSALYAVLSIIFILCSTPFMYYLRYQPLMSHVLSAFTVSLFMYAWILQYKKELWYRYFYLGVLLGIVSLVRWQDSIMGIIFLVEWFHKNKAPATWIYSIRNWSIFFMGFLATFSPQLLFWKELYGSYIVIPQGPAFFTANLSYYLNFIFSFKHGLVSWSPITAFAYIGLILYVLKKNDPMIKVNRSQIISFLGVIFLAVVINASLADWHGSDSFGARRMVALFPLFSLGVYLLLLSSKMMFQISLIALFMLLSIYNVLFADLYFVHKIDHYSRIYPSEVLQKIQDQYIRKN